VWGCGAGGARGGRGGHALVCPLCDAATTKRHSPNQRGQAEKRDKGRRQEKGPSYTLREGVPKQTPPRVVHRALFPEREGEGEPENLTILQAHLTYRALIRRYVDARRCEDTLYQWLRGGRIVLVGAASD